MLDQTTLVAEVNNENIDIETALDLKDVPQNCFGDCFNKRIGLELDFFGEAGTETTNLIFLYAIHQVL